jgi:hypothetical protein
MIALSTAIDLGGRQGNDDRLEYARTARLNRKGEAPLLAVDEELSSPRMIMSRRSLADLVWRYSMHRTTSQLCSTQT